jgi:hypothetical protein
MTLLRRSFVNASGTARDNCEYFQYPYVVRPLSYGWGAERLEARDTPIGMALVGVNPGGSGEVWYPSSNWVLNGGLFYGGENTNERDCSGNQAVDSGRRAD